MAYVLAVKGMPGAEDDGGVTDAGAEAPVPVVEPAGAPSVPTENCGGTLTGRDGHPGPADQATALEDGQEDDLWGPTAG